MELFLIILALVLLVLAYFLFGIFVKFLLAWWILTFGTPVLFTFGIAFGWVGAIFAIIGFLILLDFNNSWQGSELYVTLERKVDNIFYLSDT